MVTVRLELAPPKTMLATGTRLVFEELAERVKLAAGVCPSMTVKAIAAVAVSSKMDWLVIVEMACGRLGALIVNMPDELVEVCPSGFVTVTVRAPAAAPAATLRLRVILVGLLNVTELTVMPPPLTMAERRFENPLPGS